MTSTLIPEVTAIQPQLIIFDKDGTLIDFQAMWGTWAKDLARKLQAATYLPVADPLFAAIAFEPQTGHIPPDGPLALAPADELYRIICQVLTTAGVSAAGVQAAMAAAWHTPDPVTLAKPLADLTGLFGTLKSEGLRIAIATSDDHAPTEALISAWGLSPLVDAIIGADDGFAHKPDPQMLLHLSDRFNQSPAKAIMVGDNPDDLRMGRAAAVGLTVGVLSGLGSKDNLGPLADVILADVGRLISP